MRLWIELPYNFTYVIHSPDKWLFLKKFKRPKSREDSSNFDDFRTKRIVSAQPIFENFSKERNERKDFEKFENFRKFSEIIYVLRYLCVKKRR